MKLLIRLAVVALLVNACWRVGSAYASYYRFKDAVQDATQRPAGRNDAQVRTRVYELATEYGIPFTEETLTVTRRDNHTIVDGAYKVPILFFPRVTYDWPFEVHVDTFLFDGGGLR